MGQSYHLLGTIGPSAGHDEPYWEQRDTFLDCRGTLICHGTAHFGFGVMILTASHAFPIVDGTMGVGQMTKTTVQIDAHAFICSRALLYRCHIGEHAVIAAGAVVKGVEIPPWTMADGNPAHLVAVWRDGVWHPYHEPIAPVLWRPAL
jgi:acetyltransferase-like isoleucine patch superfamily enzyme